MLSSPADPGPIFIKYFPDDCLPAENLRGATSVPAPFQTLSAHCLRDCNAAVGAIDDADGMEFERPVSGVNLPFQRVEPDSRGGPDPAIGSAPYLLT